MNKMNDVNETDDVHDIGDVSCPGDGYTCEQCGEEIFRKHIRQDAPDMLDKVEESDRVETCAHHLLIDLLAETYEPRKDAYPRSEQGQYELGAWHAICRLTEKVGKLEAEITEMKAKKGKRK